MRVQYSIHKNADHLRTFISGDWTPGKESEEIIRFLENVTEACRKAYVGQGTFYYYKDLYRTNPAASRS